VIVRFESLSAPQRPEEFSHLIGERIWLWICGRSALPTSCASPAGSQIGRPGNAVDPAPLVRRDKGNSRFGIGSTEPNVIEECWCEHDSDAAQREYWNTVAGPRWVGLERTLHPQTRRFRVRARRWPRQVGKGAYLPSPSYAMSGSRVAQNRIELVARHLPWVPPFAGTRLVRRTDRIGRTPQSEVQQSRHNERSRVCSS